MSFPVKAKTMVPCRLKGVYHSELIEELDVSNLKLDKTMRNADKHKVTKHPHPTECKQVELKCKWTAMIEGSREQLLCFLYTLSSM